MLATRQDFKLSSEFEARADSASLLQQLADSIFALVFPTACSLCGSELATAGWLNICDRCWEHLEPWRGAACAKCGLPFPSEVTATVTAASGAATCGRCRTGVY